MIKQTGLERKEEKQVCKHGSDSTLSPPPGTGMLQSPPPGAGQSRTPGTRSAQSPLRPHTHWAPACESSAPHGAAGGATTDNRGSPTTSWASLSGTDAFRGLPLQILPYACLKCLVRHSRCPHLLWGRGWENSLTTGAAVTQFNTVLHAARSQHRAEQSTGASHGWIWILYFHLQVIQKSKRTEVLKSDI